MINATYPTLANQFPRPARALKAKAAAGAKPDMNHWTLDRLIKVAAELKILPPAVETLPNDN